MRSILKRPAGLGAGEHRRGLPRLPRPRAPVQRPGAAARRAARERQDVRPAGARGEALGLVHTGRAHDRRLQDRGREIRPKTVADLRQSRRFWWPRMHIPALQSVRARSGVPGSRRAQDHDAERGVDGLEFEKLIALLSQGRLYKDAVASESVRFIHT